MQAGNFIDYSFHVYGVSLPRYLLYYSLFYCGRKTWLFKHAINSVFNVHWLPLSPLSYIVDEKVGFLNHVIDLGFIKSYKVRGN